jgi:tRNA threonylcarbamoyladenosine biosynthesis protein TsaB
MPAHPEPWLPVLALDTATETMSAGLQTGTSAHTTHAPGGALASAALLPMLHGLLAQAGLTWRDLRAIAFGRGPGAFTGVRTACSVAQGLGFGIGCPLLPLDSLLVVAEDARVQAGADEGFDVVVAMDARMDEIYTARYLHQGRRWHVLQAPALAGRAAFNAMVADQPVRAVAGTALDAFGNSLVLPAQAGRWPHEHDRAAALLRLARQAAVAGQGVPAADALPLYLREKVAFTTAERLAARAQAAA